MSDVKQFSVGGQTVMVKDEAARNAMPKYGTSATSGDIASKEVTTTGGDFSLQTGAAVYVKFANSDTAGSITLNVDGTGAKPVLNGGAAVAADSIKSTTVYGFIYNGEAFDMTSGGAGGGNDVGLSVVDGKVCITYEAE